MAGLLINKMCLPIGWLEKRSRASSAAVSKHEAISHLGKLCHIGRLFIFYCVLVLLVHLSEALSILSTLSLVLVS